MPLKHLSRRTVQLITGHGEFGMHLYRIGKRESGLCELCQVEDDPIHRITTCSIFEDIRNTISIQLDTKLPMTPSLLLPILYDNQALFAPFGEQNLPNPS